VPIGILSHPAFRAYVAAIDDNCKLTAGACGNGVREFVIAVLPPPSGSGAGLAMLPLVPLLFPTAAIAVTLVALRADRVAAPRRSSISAT
jgi:hypothetical protein